MAAHLVQALPLPLPLPPPILAPCQGDIRFTFDDPEADLALADVMTMRCVAKTLSLCLLIICPTLLQLMCSTMCRPDRRLSLSLGVLGNSLRRFLTAVHCCNATSLVQEKKAKADKVQMVLEKIRTPSDWIQMIDRG